MCRVGPLVVGADLTRITAADSNVGALVVSTAWAVRQHTDVSTSAALALAVAPLPARLAACALLLPPCM